MKKKELLVRIDWPSCKALNVDCDDFSAALHREFKTYECEFKTHISASPVHTHYPSGYTGFGLVNIPDTDLANIRRRVEAVFQHLAKKNQLLRPEANDDAIN